MQVSEFVLGRRDSTVAENAMMANKAASSGKGFILSGSERGSRAGALQGLMGLNSMLLVIQKCAIDDE